MYKKIAKGLSLFAFILLSVGMFFFAPTLKQGELVAEEVAQDAKSVSDDSLSSASLWSSVIEGQETSFIQITSGSSGLSELEKGLVKTKSVFRIEDANDLAKLAYYVNTGAHNNPNDYYILKANIDLAGSLWTPIGTYSNPFRGNFIGQGYTISNVTVNELSMDTNASSGAGLFGNVGGTLNSTTGGSVSEVIIGGVYNISGASSDSKKGALIGVLNNVGEMINCYDATTSKNGTNNIIGTKSGTAYAGKSVVKEGVTESPSATSIGLGNNNYGKVGFYTISDGEFRKENNQHVEKNIYRQISNIRNVGVTNPNIVYSVSNLTLRVNANSGTVYPIKFGVKFKWDSFSDVVSSSNTTWVCNLSQDNSSITFSINNGYGGRRSDNVTYSAGYDQPFSTIFNNAGLSRLFKRVGYDINQIVDSNTNITKDYSSSSWDNGLKYNQSFVDNGATYNVSYKSNSSNTYKVIFEMESKELSVDNGGKFNFNGIESITMGSNGTASKFDVKQYNVKEVTSGKDTVFTVNLKNTYEIASYRLNFINTTGTNSSYQYNGKNCDSHLSESVSNSGKTFTLKNVVGTDGEIIIVVRRLERKIPLSIQSNGQGEEQVSLTLKQGVYSNTSNLPFYFTYQENNQWKVVNFSESITIKEKDVKSAKYYLVARCGEDISLEISTKNSTNASVILDCIVGTGLSIPTHTGVGAVISKEYYDTWNVNLKVGDSGFATTDSSNLYFKVHPANIVAKVDVTANFEGNDYTSGDYTSGLGFKINDSSQSIFNGQAFVNVRNTNQNDKLEATKNSYWYPASITIDGTGVDFSNNIIEASAWTYINKIWNVNEPSKYHTITVNYKLRTDYGIGVKFSITDTNGTTQLAEIKDDDKLIETKTFSTAVDNIKFGTKGTLTVTLSEYGTGILYFKTVKTSDLNSAGTKTDAKFSTFTKSGNKIIFTVNYTVGTVGKDDDNKNIYIEFGLRQFELNVTKFVKDDGSSFSYYDGNISYKRTIKFGYTAKDSQSVDNDDAVLGRISLKSNVNDSEDGVSIDTGYYLIGWMINGSKAYGTFRDYLTNPTFKKAFIGRIAQKTTTEEQFKNLNSITYEDMKAYGGQREVKIDLSIDSSGAQDQHYRKNQGDWVDSVQTETFFDKLHKGDSITLSNSWTKFGYSFSGFYYNQNKTFSNGASWTLNNDWDNIFGITSNDSGTYWWNGFYDNAIKSKSTNATIKLTSQWTKNKYTFTIDGQTTISEIEITKGNSISVSLGSKEVSASYLVGGKSARGISKTGSIAVGFRISQNASKEIKADYANAITYDSKEGKVSFKLEYSEDLLNVLKETYYSSGNNASDPIKIETIFANAVYKIYIKPNVVNNKNASTVVWSGDNNAYGGSDNNGVFVYVTYGSTPSNIGNAITNKNLVVTRTGYSVVPTQWRIGDSTGSNFVSTSEKFNISNDYEYYPTWTKTSNTLSSGIGYDVEGRRFYLATSYDIVSGSISGVGVSGNPEINKIIDNGEKITAMRFIINSSNKIELTGKNYKFNISSLNSMGAGTYSLQFVVEVQDTLNSSIKYTTTSASLASFTMVKNTLNFEGQNLTSKYNADNKFIPDEDNSYGSYGYMYSWNGIKTSANKSVEENFYKFEISDSNVNAGTDKQIKFAISSNFGTNDNFDKTYGKNYDQLFDNVTKEGQYYYVTLNNATINKARFSIDFGKGTNYYFEGINEVIVKENSSYITFTVSGGGVSGTTFTYTYSRILLIPREYKTYKGTQVNSTDKQIFTVENLQIAGHDSDRDSNFEWSISTDSEFTLLNPTNAGKYIYVPKLLTYNSGVKLNDYADVTLNLGTVVVNGSTVSISNQKQGSYSVGGNVLFAWANNGTQNFMVYVNNAILGANTLKYNVVLRGIEDTSKQTLLAWGTAVNTSDYERLLDNDFASILSYTQEVSTINKITTYAVVSDLLKVYIDYNGGANNGKESDVIYLKSTDSALNLANPTHPYSGISFNGYSNPANARLTITSGSGVNFFKASKAGKSENISAKWTFNNVVYKNKTTTFDLYASRTGLNLSYKDMIDVSYPQKTTTSYAYTLSSSAHNLTFTADASGNFDVKNGSGMAVSSMTGAYDLTVSVTYSDGQSNPQTKTATIKIQLNINLNSLGISYSGGELTFNNSSREGDISIMQRLNGNNTSSTLLSQIPTSDNSGSEYGYYAVISSTLGYKTINRADDYTVAIKVDSNLKEVYQIEAGKGAVAVKVNKFSIVLRNYQDQLALNKVFGLADPNPIVGDIIINENSNDVVSLIFTRASGENIGLHKLSFSQIRNQDDQSDYTVNDAGFESYFEILTPQTKLQILLSSGIKYNYNGQTPSSYVSSYNGTNFTLTLTIGSDKASTTFDMYYLQGATKVSIPVSERENYAGYVTFGSENVEKTVGKYNLNVNLSSNIVGSWTGVEFVNGDIATITVEKRIISLDELNKTFDQTTNFVYNNRNASISNSTATISNIVEGDEIQISGTYALSTAGNQNITSLNLDQTSVSENYTLTSKTGVTMLVHPSKAKVNLTTNVTNLDYGKIKQSSTHQEIMTLIPTYYNNGTISAGYINNDASAIKNTSFSTGKYLTVGSYTITFTLSSINYTFEGEEGSIGDVYTKTYDINFTVNKINLIITNSNTKIAKKYDGNNKVLNEFVGINVNARGGYYTSKELLSGDVITIVSATYPDREIGQSKVVTLVLSGDYTNYNVTQNVVGDINPVDLVFIKNVETINFVDGVKDFSNTSNIVYTYTGHIDDLVATLTNENNFAQRVGYTQAAWEYQNKRINDMTESEKENLLQMAVDASSKGLTLDAVWQINKYIITFDTDEHTSITAKTKEVSYYDSITNILVSISAGYTFEDVRLSQQNATLQIINGQGTRSGEFSVIHILGDVTVSVVSDEISVKIIIDYAVPENGLSVSSSTEGWTNGVKERVLPYSILSSQDLPVVKVDQQHTFDFVCYLLNGKESTGSSIWERINGDALTQNNLAGYTFVATWTESDVIITVSYENATVTMNKVVGESKTPVNQVNKTFTVKYNDSVEFNIVSNNWYKWQDVAIVGTFNGAIPTATNLTKGAFALDTVKSYLTINLSITPIKVKLSSQATALEGSSLNEKSGSLTGDYDITLDSNTTLGDILPYYTLTAGTYEQDYYINNDSNFIKTQKAQDVVLAVLGAIPTSDCEIEFTAHFVGLTYTFTFVKDKEDAYFDEAGKGSENTVLSVIRKYVYGDLFSRVPTLTSPGQYAVWMNDADEQVEDGVKFVSKIPNANLALTIRASWSNKPTKVTVNFTSDKILGATFDGTEIKSGFTTQALWGSSKVFTFTLATGYEIDSVKTVITSDIAVEGITHENAGIQVSGNKVTITSIKGGDVVFVVETKAKDYTLTIDKSQYENISQTEFNVSYDQDISSILNNVTIARNGYSPVSLISSDGKVFASYSSPSWTISANFTEGSLYKYDGSLNLDVVWKTTKTYVSASITPVQNLYFNASEQIIASATLTALNGENVAKGVTLANGDKVADIYFMLNGNRAGYGANYTLSYRNAINTSAYIVVELQDTLLGTTDIVYTALSGEGNVEIKPSKVVIKNASLEGYYTGNANFEATENNTYGSLFYQDDTSLNELSVNHIEVIDSQSLFDAGKSYNVKYFFNTSGLFNISNYSSLVVEGSYITYLEPLAKASIKQSTIILSVNGSGFFNDKVQEVKNSSVKKPTYLDSGFKVVINSIKTKLSAVGSYSNAENFDFDVDVMFNDLNKTSNFIFEVEGTYKIISQTEAYKVSLLGKTFTVTDVVDSGLVITINRITYQGQNILVPQGDYNHIYNGELIFSVTNNGGTNAFVMVANNKSVEINFTLGGEMAVLDCTDDISLSSLTQTLNKLTAEQSRTFGFTATQERNVYVVTTEYKAVLLSYGDKQGDQGYAYVKKGGSVAIENKGVYTGFDFAYWQSDDSSLSVNENTLSLAENGKITSSFITAIWEIADINATATNVTRKAKTGVGAVVDEINLIHILSTNGIVNRNNDALNYAFEILRNSSVVYSGENGFVPLANTTTNGTYTLKITASRNGYVSKVNEFDFEIIVEKLSLDKVEINQSTFTYENYDFANDITFTFTGATLGKENLKDIINKDFSQSTYFFALSGKDNQTILNAGQYLLTLNLDKTVFENFDYSANIVVNKYSQVISSVPAELLSKRYAENDPQFEFSTTFFSTTSHPEDVAITLVRESGESVGKYLMSIKEIDKSENFNLILDNIYFTINVSNNTLNILIDNDLSVVYSKQVPNFAFSFNAESGKWIVSMGSSSSEVSLTITNDEGEETVLTGILYENALENISLTTEVFRAGSYSEKNASISLANGANFEKTKLTLSFNIEKYGVKIATVSKVFDRTNNITEITNRSFEMLFTGDSVSFDGNFDNAFVGENHTLTNLVLTGTDKDNYYIANIDFAKAVINPMTAKNINVNLSKSNFVYGDISKQDSLSEILTKVVSLNLAVDGNSSDIANGFVTIDSYSFSESDYSNANLVKVGTRIINIKISSQNILGFNPDGYEFSLNVAKKELDLAKIVIAKNYDSTTDMPKDLNLSLDGYIFFGDDAYIDKTASKFKTAEVSDSIKISLVLAGQDSDNYSVKDNVYGSISSFYIYVTVTPEENETLIPGYGKFVEDKQVVVGTNTRGWEFPIKLTSETLYSTLPTPTRKGYTLTGWKIIKNDSYVDVTSNNVLQILTDVGLDETNTTKTINFYPTWSRDYININVVGDEISSYSITGEDVVGDSTNGYKARYYTNFTLVLNANTGKKVKAFTLTNGDNTGTSSLNLETNSAMFVVQNIGSEALVTTLFEDIKITFDIKENVPALTDRTDRNSLTKVFNYLELDSLTKQDLPTLTATEGTFNHTDFLLNGQKIENKTLKEVVDSQIANLTKDETISLIAFWQGVNYKIYFNENGGTLTGDNPINAVFGSAINETMPSAYLIGRSYTWVAPDDAKYSQGDILSTIGALKNGVYTLTLSAVWTNNTYALTVNFDEKISVSLNGKPVQSGDNFDVTYNETTLDFAVTSAQGYLFNVNKESLNGTLNVSGSIYSVSLLSDDGTIEFVSTPDDNDMTVYTNFIESVSAMIDGKDAQINDGTITVKTESEVTLTFKAVKGYEFENTSIVFVGSGNISISISEDKKTLSLVWSNFTSDGLITANAVPATNLLTLKDNSSRFTNISLNGISVSLGGGDYGFKTGQSITVVAHAKYGYDNISAVLSNSNFVLSNTSCTFDNTNKVYVYSGIISSFNDNFALTFALEEREYSFNITVGEGFEGIGQIDCQTNQTVLFGQTLSLAQTVLNDNYAFRGWVVGNEIISYDASIVLDNEFKSALENQTNGVIEVKATYVLKAVDITIGAGRKGQLSFTTKNGDTIVVNGGSYTTQTILIGRNVEFALTPDEGYEFDQVLVNDVALGENEITFDSTNNIVSVFVSIESIPDSIFVTFKASKVYVNVMSQVMIDYAYAGPTDKGGKIYISDKDGNRLDDSFYLANGQDLQIGVDYIYQSYTDSTIYFVIEPNSGFSGMVEPSSEMILNQYKVGEKYVYACSGVKAGSSVRAVFFANANAVKVAFINSETGEIVPAGRISVDTSSNSIIASGNNSSIVSVSAITGSNLSFTINTNPTFTLNHDGYGVISYSCSLPAELEEGETVITPSRMSTADINATGFRNYATLDIANVTCNVTIYILVTPKVYNLELYVTENNRVTVENAVAYGKQVNLSSMTEEQKAVMLMQRKDFTLGGYYTKQLGQGYYYIDKDGQSVNLWNETGYTFNGSTYELSENYNEETSTFTLYAYWLYNKSYIEIEFAPEDVETNSENDITDVIQDINYSTLWTTQDNRWYAEVVAGIKLTLKGLDYNGYEFAYWLVSKDGGEGQIKDKVFEMNFEQGSYKVKAIYHPTMSITIVNEDSTLGVGSSDAFFMQDGEKISGSFDSSKTLSIVAIPDRGYDFKYFVDEDTNLIVSSVYSSTLGGYVALVENQISQIHIKAVFAGKEVKINLDASSALEHHEIVEVVVNGTTVDDYGHQFVAKVGQTMTIEATKSLGYDFELLGATFVRTAKNGNILFSYVISIDDIAYDGSVYFLNLQFNSVREKINLHFTLAVNSAVDGNEVARAFEAKFVDTTGKTTDILEQNTFGVLYGDSVVVRVKAKDNYSIGEMFVREELLQDISSLYNNEQLVIDEMFMRNYFSYTIEIQINANRLAWTDNEVRSLTLDGDGTKSSPFIVRSAEDMGFVAYVVNNGIMLNEQTPYSKCYYSVESNIDFAGRFFEPIGTKEHPFEGTFDLADYQFENISHYKTYENPNTSYSGLFWIVSKDANIIQSKATIIVTIIILVIIGLSMATTIIIVLIVRKNRKKKLQEDENIF